MSNKPVLVTLLDNGIINIKYNEPKITLEAAKIVVQERMALCNGISRPVLIEGTSVSNIDKNARDYFTDSKNVKFISASAFVTENTITRFLANFFLKVNFNSNAFPVRLFQNKETAIIWLLTFL